jgi:NADH-quinone oxidoreductase subunit F
MTTDLLTPVLSAHWDEPDSYTMAAYKRHGGYEALPKAFGMHQDAIIQLVKASGLRGRGGAGFPTGLKWGFIPQGDGKPHYLVVNADESEPGTCKDVPIMLANPHVLIEGAIIASYAIRATHAFIYVRGEVLHVVRRLRHAVDEAYEAGYLGQNILGSGYDLELVVHAGAGAYICGEETALLDSLEGRRGQPRLRPPFPAVAGLYAAPTVVNNVESIASVPSIVANGPDWFAAMGTEKSSGFGFFSLSGHISRAGQYEAPLGVTLRQLIDLAGGVRAGHELKFWTPGGSSTPILTAEHLDVPLDFEAVGAAGSLLGTRALQIFDDTTCVVRAVLRWTEFYAHESCGKCTPCREGTYWLVQILDRLERGEGRADELDQLLDISDNILGRAFCALGDGAVAPITSSIQYFRDEYLAHLDNGGCPFDPAASALFAEPTSQRPDGFAASAAGSVAADTPGRETPPEPNEGPGARADD